MILCLMQGKDMSVIQYIGKYKLKGPAQINTQYQENSLISPISNLCIYPLHMF